MRVHDSRLRGFPRRIWTPRSSQHCRSPGTGSVVERPTFFVRMRWHQPRRGHGGRPSDTTEGTMPFGKGLPRRASLTQNTAPRPSPAVGSGCHIQTFLLYPCRSAEIPDTGTGAHTEFCAERLHIFCWSLHKGRVSRSIARTWPRAPSQPGVLSADERPEVCGGRTFL